MRPACFFASVFVCAGLASPAPGQQNLYQYYPQQFYPSYGYVYYPQVNGYYLVYYYAPQPQYQGYVNYPQANPYTQVKPAPRANPVNHGGNNPPPVGAGVPVEIIQETAPPPLPLPPSPLPVTSNLPTGTVPFNGFDQYVQKETGPKGKEYTPPPPNTLENQPAPYLPSELPPAGPACELATPKEICGPPGRIWARGEYLLWWTKGNRLPPLLTTSPPGTPLADAGVLGKTGTSVLFGDETVNDGSRSGGRFTVGGWFNRCQTTGIEANFFFLEHQSTSFDIASDGLPILARPFFDVQAGQNNSLKIAYPGFVTGSFHATVTSNFWGGEAYLRQNLCCGCHCRLDLLGGYRFLHLKEGLQITETEIDADPNSPLFGIPIVIREGFDTTNNFNGGEIGLMGEYRHGRCFVQLVGKVALGATNRTVNINGSTQVNDFAPITGGFLALPSNIGSHRSTVFSVVPEVGINVGCQLTKRIRVMMGYTFLYWTNVARPGDQIDLAVNLSQPPLGNALVGPARPAFNFNNSDFWAQGVSFGLEFRY